MSQDFEKLSYKELQALAVEHQIPRNIKKDLLVEFLRATKCGNENQVSRMLMELKENRKRKVRKRKLERLEKMTAVTSTPLHSPNYSSIEDRFYSPQHLSPYRWATPEEEVRREDPHYERFRQYLIQKIQKNYQNLDTNNNDIGIEPTALNLKAGALEYNSRSNVMPETSSFLNSTALETQQSSNYQETQSLNNDSENNYRPMILQKMLQAPLGTNLGAMARLEANRIWPMENHLSRNIDDNNSDTVTADSESLEEERIDSNYYFENKRSQGAYNDPIQVPQFNLDQMINYFQNQNGYQNNQLNFALSSIQENCQTWIENSLDYRGPVDYTADSSRMYGSYSAEDQTNYQFQVDSNLPIFSENNQSVENHNLQSLNPYYQVSAQHGHSYRTEFFDQNNPSTLCTNNSTFGANPTFTATNPTFSASSSTFSASNPTYSANNLTFNTNLAHQFNTLQTQESSFVYPQDCTTSASFPGVENFQYSGYQQNQCTNATGLSMTSTVAQTNGHAQSKQDVNLLKEGNISDLTSAYWPKWRDNPGEYHLENVLNLNVGGTTDYAKFNQTSSVYCFAPPLSSPLSGTSNSQHFERAEFVSASRFSSCISNGLVYSDSTTGMRMAKLTRNNVEETESEGSSITAGYRSDDSCHPEPIQEIWITDFENHQKDDNHSPSSSCATISE